MACAPNIIEAAIGRIAGMRFLRHEVRGGVEGAVFDVGGEERFMFLLLLVH